MGRSDQRRVRGLTIAQAARHRQKAMAAQPLASPWNNSLRRCLRHRVANWPGRPGMVRLLPTSGGAREDSMQTALRTLTILSSLILSLWPSCARAAVGDSEASVRRSALVAQGRFFVADESPVALDLWRLVLRPRVAILGPDRAELHVSVGSLDRTEEMELRLSRALLDGPHAIFARNFVVRFLRDALPAAAREPAALLVDRVERWLPPVPLAPGEIAEAKPPAAADADAPTRALAVFEGRPGRLEQVYGPVRMTWETVWRSGSPFLCISVALRSELVFLPAGPAQPSLQNLPPPFSGSDAADMRGPPGELGAWRASFLDAQDLGHQFLQVRDTRMQGAEPADAAFDRLQGRFAGDVLWIDGNDGPIWRLVETRWALPDAASARTYFDQTVARGVPDLTARTDLDMPGLQMAAFSGYAPAFFAGTKPSRMVYFVLAGSQVVRLDAIQGPDARTPLYAALMGQLALRAAARVPAP